MTGKDSLASFPLESTLATVRVEIWLAVIWVVKAPLSHWLLLAVVVITSAWGNRDAGRMG